jgi:hypothetical protein
MFLSANFNDFTLQVVLTFIIPHVNVSFIKFNPIVALLYIFKTVAELGEMSPSRYTNTI